MNELENKTDEPERDLWMNKNETDEWTRNETEWTRKWTDERISNKKETKDERL